MQGKGPGETSSNLSSRKTRVEIGFARDRSLWGSRKARHRVMAGAEGKIDLPYPGLAMVSERAGQRDPAHDLRVRDCFVLGGGSCRLQE